MPRKGISSPIDPYMTNQDALKPKKRFPYILTVLMLIALAVLVSLGNWQKQRLAWKEALLTKIETRLDAEPITLEALEARFNQGEDIAYIPVIFSGEFLHDKEQHYFATYKGASGYFVYTPVQIEGREQILFANRGFVPFDRKEANTRQDGQTTGLISFKGVARFAPSEKPSSVVPNNDLSKNIYYWKDISNMSAQAGYKMASKVVPFFVDLDDAPNKGGFPIGGVTRVDLPNNHLQYMVTWYGIALTLLGVYVAYIIQWRRKTAR